MQPEATEKKRKIRKRNTIQKIELEYEIYAVLIRAITTKVWNKRCKTLFMLTLCRRVLYSNSN